MDNVNSPKHYINTNMECIDVMLATYGEFMVEDFCILNAFKYRWRYKEKGGLEDLYKAQWYCQTAKSLVDENKETDQVNWFLLTNIASSVEAAIQDCENSNLNDSDNGYQE